MLDLKVFQAESAKQIVKRYAFFANHPDRPSKGRNKPRPFFQALSALTGAGKTPILAQAVALMRAHFCSEPIVFWMSKAKSVVAQTYTNFSPGGKYSEIIDGFRVVTVPQLTPQIIADSTTPLIIMATTGLFNNKDQSDGTLNIYKSGQDAFGEKSPWQRLIERADEGKRRPLLIVYDEGHNMSEQQTKLLAELEPDAYLLASATLRLPEDFHKSIIHPIALWLDELQDGAEELAELGALNDKGRSDAKRFITTAVDSGKVINAQLVKKAIQFDGTTSPMEKCLDDLLTRMHLLKTEIDNRALNFPPKAIYVCKTNIADDGEKDDSSMPFKYRSAPPIRIWRYLVEEKGVDPKDVAIYANLAFSDGSKPDSVNLFSKGENDFDQFSAGNYQHIIFNLSLQEGWDDPCCYLAYIDKSMGSAIQVEQIIGRVLRQYKAQHYENPLLNSAHFFIRVDSQQVFAQSIKAVRAKLQVEGAAIEIISNFGGGSDGAEDLYPKEDALAPLHHIFVDSESARERIREIIGNFPTFLEGSPDAKAPAHTTSHLLELTDLEGGGEPVQWKTEGNTNPVRLRWLVNTAVKARSSSALAILDTNEAKFDARVQIHSVANKYAEKLAAEVVEAFYQLSELVYESLRPFQFSVIRVPKNGPAFSNGLYERYAGFNRFEEDFAGALDEEGSLWHRNHPSGGFYIPLLSEGDTSSFYPDFIVWTQDMVYCLDTKGGHLLSDAVARKLFDIQEEGRTKLRVRFISEGKQRKLGGKAIRGGYTVWRMHNGSPSPVFVDDLTAAVKECLR